MRDVHPDVWQTGGVNFRTGADDARGTHDCPLGHFKINRLWDKHHFEAYLYRKKQAAALGIVTSSSCTA